MRALVFISAAILAVMMGACSSDGFDEPIDPTTDPPPMTPPPVPSRIARTGSAPVTLTGGGADVVVSFGLPFPQGVLTSPRDVTLKNAKGEPVPIARSVLATWPADGSIRSVLVVTRATLAAGASEDWRVEWGAPSTSPDLAPSSPPQGASASPVPPNPDGPINATLPPDHYAKSHVSGVILPIAANQRFARYDAELAKASAAFDLSQFGIDCGSSTTHRTYYDGVHARYQRFLRSGDPRHLRDARVEARWFRDNEIAWYADRKVAVHKCQPRGWTPEVPLDWGVLRMMLAQGMLDDYLVTGDPAAKEALVAMGEGYRRNLPVLSEGNKPILEITERNLGWTLMGLASYFAVDPRNEVRDAMRGLVSRAIAWQARGSSGALEHDLERPDPDECGSGPNGASPFMTSLLVDGMMDYWLLTGDTAALAPFMTKLATWYEKSALTSDRKAFRYLWNCLTEPYDDSEVADLNLLINHVFGAAYAVTKDKHWIDFGDHMADEGIEAIFAKRPKQWNQTARSFGKYLGYREL